MSLAGRCSTPPGRGREADGPARADDGRVPEGHDVGRGTPRTRARPCRSSGPGGDEVTVDLTVPYGTARKLKLASPRLDREKVTLAADGTAQVALRPGKKARKKLRRAKQALALTVTARAGDRIATSGATATLQSAGTDPGRGRRAHRAGVDEALARRQREHGDPLRDGDVLPGDPQRHAQGQAQGRPEGVARQRRP